MEVSFILYIHYSTNINWIPTILVAYVGEIKQTKVPASDGGYMLFYIYPNA